MQPVEAYLILSSVLFMLGIAGFLLRRDPIVRLLAIGIIFVAATINLAAFSIAQGGPSGEIFAILLGLAIAAEFAVVATMIRRGRRKSSVAGDSRS